MIWFAPTKSGVRGDDPMGSGHFGAKRGNRLHAGVDFLAHPGEFVYAPCSSKVNRIGLPYADAKKNHYRLIELVRGVVLIRIMYVSPSVRTGDELSAGTIIGYAQDISSAHPNADGERVMENHVHLDMRLSGAELIKNGKAASGTDPYYINPEFLFL